MAWGIVIATTCAALLVSPLVWDAGKVRWRAYKERPRPVIASAGETRDILGAVVQQHEFYGEPLPPPPPPANAMRSPRPFGDMASETSQHHGPAARQRQVIMLSDESVCFAGELVTPECPRPEFGLIGYEGGNDIPAKLAAEMLMANRAPASLAVEGIPGTRVISRAKLEQLFVDDAWWEGFYAEFPEAAGFLSVGVPVLSEDRKTALIYVGHSCGGLCGVGLVFLLRREAGGWKITFEDPVWIS